MAIYVPRVMLCGSVDEFKKIIGNKAVEVVGQIFFQRTGDTGKLFLNGHELNGNDIRNLLNGSAEYLLFTDDVAFTISLDSYPRNEQMMTAAAFAKKNYDGFSTTKTLNIFQAIIQEKISGRVLDFDCYLAKNDCHTMNDLCVDVECVAENFGGELLPIHENVYRKIHRTLDDCHYHTFNAISLTRERTPDEFFDALIATDSLSKKILAFVRKNSALENWLSASENFFAKVETFRIENGAWCLLEKRVTPDDVGVYIVTHKDAKLDTVPEGYRIIHAGHAQATTDFGYAGDDTGDNISNLNRYLDEITAFYWIWKNTAHTHVGFVHYRRFLTIKTNRQNDSFAFEDILSATEIVELLNDYDIITSLECISNRTQRELMIWSTGSPDLVRIAEKILRKHLARTQPDYLDAFDAVMDSFLFFAYGIHVTRRNIFDDYCKWLFSFIIDATAEVIDKVIFDGRKLEELPHMYSRIMSFFAERMFTVWLMKNHLRIKPLPVMYRDDV